MAEPTIIEIQPQIIEMDGKRYQLECVSCRGLKRTQHQQWCVHCDGNGLAPREDEDRIRIFDHYCYGHRKPLLCEPESGIVYKQIDSPNA